MGLSRDPQLPGSLGTVRFVPGARAAGIAGPWVQGPMTSGGWVSTVSEGSVEEEKGLQTVFSTVLKWDDETPTRIPYLGLALGFGSMAFVLLLM